ncbi:MFS transporter [Desulfobacula phenolica]|uniref:MFS transporter, OFA family, oxalate/formate antiporter n=1 Tax=Desulfobacula phenolica TaxID=90732 RepID=A0A1H2IDS0_9BACT|nr:MFS transporter [Desulfobacula phenolica]SDU42287.1 MFS transporter, OFA family, oxalate/formate antiporter [Desulfobacula phenolica]
MPLLENKKIILFFGCLAIFFPGAFVFGFPGVMASEWQTLFHVNKAQIGRLMFFVLAGTGSAMYLAGKLQEKIPSRFIIFTGSLACSLATLFVGQATCMEHVYIWAFFEGFFCAFVYIPCLTIFQKMFPENKGLITGILNLTFGGSSAVMSPIFTYLLVLKGYEFTSVFAGFLSIVFGTSVAFLIKTPGKDKAKGGPQLSTLSFKQTVSLSSFRLLWCVWALSGAAGVSLIVLASSFGRQLGYGITQYVYILTCFNILNGIGRLVCGRLSDRYSKQKILMIVFLMASCAYCLMPWFSHLYLVSFLACFIGLAFGALFTVSAPLVTEVFGLENFGKVFGLVFTAYGFFAGFLGPWLSGIILDMTHSNFKIVFSLFAVFYLISSVLIMRVKIMGNDKQVVACPSDDQGNFIKLEQSS